MQKQSSNYCSMLCFKKCSKEIEELPTISSSQNHALIKINSPESIRQHRPDQQLPQNITALNFEKLSLRRVKETHANHFNHENSRVMKRVESFKRIQRPIATTERSVEEMHQNQLLSLYDLKKELQVELNFLNKDFNKYYEIYSKKLKELKEVQKKVNECHLQKLNR